MAALLSASSLVRASDPFTMCCKRHAAPTDELSARLPAGHAAVQDERRMWELDTREGGCALAADDSVGGVGVEDGKRRETFRAQMHRQLVLHAVGMSADAPYMWPRAVLRLLSSSYVPATPSDLRLTSSVASACNHRRESSMARANGGCRNGGASSSSSAAVGLKTVFGVVVGVGGRG
jgi:hypothetical protein